MRQRCENFEVTPEQQLLWTLRDAHRQAIIDTIRDSNIILTDWDSAAPGLSVYTELSTKDREARHQTRPFFDEIAYDEGWYPDKPFPTYRVRVLGHSHIALTGSSANDDSLEVVMRPMHDVVADDLRVPYDLATAVDFPARTLRVLLCEESEGSAHPKLMFEFSRYADIFLAPEMPLTIVRRAAMNRYQRGLDQELPNLTVINRMLETESSDDIHVIDQTVCRQLIAAVQKARKVIGG